MEVKTAAWSTVALVIVAFGAVVIYSIEREGLKNDLTKTQKELETHESNLEAQTRGLAKRRGDYAAIQERVAAMESIGKNMDAQQKTNGELNQRVESLRAEWKGLRQAFARDIDVVRAKTKDEVMPALKLVDGKSLKSVRFKEIKDNVVVLEHSDGIARIPLSNMTPDWMGRLALGWNPKLSAELSGQPDEPEPVAEMAAPVPTVAEVRKAHVESVKRADVKDLENKVATLNRQISEAQAAIVRHQATADEYNSKYYNALAKGNSSNHKVKRDQALKTISSLQQAISNARAQINQLTDEIAKKSS